MAMGGLAKLRRDQLTIRASFAVIAPAMVMNWKSILFWVAVLALGLAWGYLSDAGLCWLSGGCTGLEGGAM